MAQAELLEEVAAHLDPDRRRALFARLADLGLQVMMTGTDPFLFAELPEASRILKVANGRVSPYSAA